MSNLTLLRTILRLKGLKITHFRFMHRTTELHLAVKPYKNGCRCPDCGRRGRIVCQTTEFRRWEDVAVMGLRVVLWYAPKEIQCPTHGRVQEEIPWAPPHARVTYRLEWRLCALCQIMTQKAAAEILRLPTSTLSNLLHRVITRVRHGHTIRGLTTLGVDEISYCKGRTVRHPRLRPGPGACRVGRSGQGPRHHRSLLQRLAEPGVDRKAPGRMLPVGDMSPAYIAATPSQHHVAPRVTLIIDRFHLVKALRPGRRTRSHDRRSQRAARARRGGRPSRRLRWLLSRALPTSDSRANPVPQQPAELQSGASIVRGSQGVRHFWDYRYPASANEVRALRHQPPGRSPGRSDAGVMRSWA